MKRLTFLLLSFFCFSCSTTPPKPTELSLGEIVYQEEDRKVVCDAALEKAAALVPDSHPLLAVWDMEDMMCSIYDVHDLVKHGGGRDLSDILAEEIFGPLLAEGAIAHYRYFGWRQLVHVRVVALQ